MTDYEVHGLPRPDVLTAGDYRRMIDTLGDPVVVADASNRIIYANRAVEALLGWSPGDLYDQSLLTIVPPRLRDPHLRGFTRYLASRIPRIIGRPVRVPALHRDGNEIDIELSLSTLSLADGQCIFVASLRDLRERAELERQLKLTSYLRAATAASGRLSSRLDIQHVLHTVTEMQVNDFGAALARVWLFDAEHNLLHLRASAGLSTRTTDSSRARIDVATSPSKVAEVARTREAFVRNSLSGDPQFDGDWIERERIASVAVLPLLTGETLRGVLVHFSREHLLDELVEVLRTFAGIVTTALNDVELLANEQQARADAERAQQRFAFLAEASRVLAGSLDYGTTLSNVAQLAVWRLADWCTVHIVEQSGAIRQLIVAHRDPAKVEMARRLEKQFPYDPDALVGVPAVLRSGVSSLVPEITTEMLATSLDDPTMLQVLLDLGLRSSMIVPLTTRGRSLGAITFLSTDPERHYGPNDLTLAEDLARRAAVAVDNARLYADVQEAIRVRDEFLSSVSHDLKNPLTALQGQTQLLKRRATRLGEHDVDGMIAGLDTMTRTTTKMNRLIDDLVDVAHLRVGRPLTLQCQFVDLIALTRQIVADLQASASDHRIVVRTPLQSLENYLDPARVERVLTNLLSNAVKYSPRGGEVSVTIDRQENDAGPAAVIEIADRGIGIPPEDLSRIFDRFYRARNVADIPGTGIGLAGAKQIIEQHRGTVTVQSLEGEGSVFTIRLPLDCPAT